MRFNFATIQCQASLDLAPEIQVIPLKCPGRLKSSPVHFAARVRENRETLSIHFGREIRRLNQFSTITSPQHYGPSSLNKKNPDGRRRGGRRKDSFRRHFPSRISAVLSLGVDFSISSADQSLKVSRG